VLAVLVDHDDRPAAGVQVGGPLNAQCAAGQRR
jgi:hypothetical protein